MLPFLCDMKECCLYKQVKVECSVERKSTLVGITYATACVTVLDTVQHILGMRYRMSHFRQTHASYQCAKRKQKRTSVDTTANVVIGNLSQQRCGHPWSSHCLWCIIVRLATFREIKTYGLTLVYISLSLVLSLSFSRNRSDVFCRAQPARFMVT